MTLSNLSYPRAYTPLFAIVLVVFAVGCGGNASSITKAPPGNTTVTVLATSTANDQLTLFPLYFDAITLINQSGETVSLAPGYLHDEFIHLNDKSEPLFTVNVPQDTYASATAAIGPAAFQCISGNTAGTSFSAYYSYGYTPASHVAVNLPAPITISGTSMVLSLDLLVSQSAIWGGAPCQAPDGTPFTITPTFNLVEASPSQTSMSGLDGMIASIGAAGNGFTVTTDDGLQQEVTTTGATVDSNAPVWAVNTNSSTVFQGVSGLSALKAGMPIDMDAKLQADGSLLASRIAVNDTIDTNAATLSVSNGPLIAVDDGPQWEGGSPVLLAADTEIEGADAAAWNGWMGAAGFEYGSAIFQTSGRLSNVQQLPFPARFDAANAAAGQWISVTFNGTNPGDSTPLTTVTLMPQTINGTVTAIATEGGFDTYTVTLAAYDLFPQLAVQVYQNTVLSNPSTVVIYADSNTQMLNSEPIAVGAMARFNGLIFNDNGTLRMDCAQINDGVAE